ncbi:IS256 family transposase [Myxococcus sp. Y35]|uniref:IS256 family transposase n=1 Tax=Pseudomyxococcus flavus TaxID=3115648 RepID=UPI003CEDE4FF
MKKATEFAPPTQEEVGADLRALFLQAIHMTLTVLLEEEVERLVGVGRFERVEGRQDSRNGYYRRGLTTSVGKLEVEVPRTRGRGGAGAVLGRYRRRTEEVDDAITAAYVQGVSTRKMGKVTAALMGGGVGRSTVSRVTKSLEEKVEGLKRARLTQAFPYVYLDATFLDARWARAVENVSALVAYGVGEDGHRHLLAVTLGPSESQASWEELLEQLVDRGLGGVRLVIADGHSGLEAAVRRLLPEARQQRCTVHLTRNVAAKVPQRVRQRVAREVSAVFNAPSRKEAKVRMEAFKTGLGAQLPEAVACLEKGFAAATVFYEFPQGHWRRLRSTNGLERLHGEVKRRIRSVGAFPDRASALRLITTVAWEVSSVWSDRRYLDMSLLNPTQEQPVQQLS